MRACVCAGGVVAFESNLVDASLLGEIRAQFQECERTSSLCLYLLFESVLCLCVAVSQYLLSLPRCDSKSNRVETR